MNAASRWKRFAEAAYSEMDAIRGRIFDLELRFTDVCCRLPQTPAGLDAWVAELSALRDEATARLAQLTRIRDQAQVLLALLRGERPPVRSEGAR
jgi:hypothetical protein